MSQIGYYQRKLKEGLEYQDYVCERLYDIGLPVVCYSSQKYQIMKGESLSGVEIKCDMNYAKTGNLYIETKEKARRHNGRYVSSGIYRSDNTWLYVIGNYETIYIFCKAHLRLMKCRYKEIEIKRKTSKGYLLPKRVAERMAIRIVKIRKDRS